MALQVRIHLNHSLTRTVPKIHNRYWTDVVYLAVRGYVYLKGNRFTLITDHKPLVSIFSCKKGLPVLSATRLLHYALVLQAYNFDIVYRNTKDHGNADCLSRLPLKSEELELKDDIAVYQISQIETLPVTAKDLAKATQFDEHLGKLLKILQYGGQLEGKEKYTLQDGCIMYGQRVCIPDCYKAKILDELHHGHLGVVKMKAIARSYVYWQDIDQDIENSAKNCLDCARFKTDPAKAKVHHWEYPSAPWERVHIDFAGPIFERMFLLIVDAHSKWLEVYPMKTANSFKTIECLRDCFSRFGLPVVLVSDNGTQFTSQEFQTFIRSNGIKHKTCAPFKPSSNGQAERYVHTLKQSLRAMQNFAGNIQQKVSTFLMQYRKAPNMTTMISPAMLFLKRDIRTRIDLVLPDLVGRVNEKIRKSTYDFQDRIFHEGDKVAIRDYRSPNARWKFGTVMSKDGALHYTVNVQGTLYRRHVDQMRPTGDQILDKTIHVPRVSFSSETSHIGTTDNSPESTDPGGDIQNHSGSGKSTPETRQPSPTKKPSSAVLPRSTPSSTSQQTPFQPRRSQRIRRPPKRLDL
nr:uncharacterized protein K02A2.6-like [Parasteatoda tepidariorum]